MIGYAPIFVNPDSFSESVGFLNQLTNPRFAIFDRTTVFMDLYEVRYRIHTFEWLFKISVKCCKDHFHKLIFSLHVSQVYSPIHGLMLVCERGQWRGDCIVKSGSKLFSKLHDLRGFATLVENPGSNYGPALSAGPYFFSDR